MIRELIEKARSDENLCRGECLVVHVSDGEIGVQEYAGLKTLMRDWEYALGDIDSDDRDNYVQRYFQTGWLAVVHEDGVLLAPLDVESCVGCEDDHGDTWKKR